MLFHLKRSALHIEVAVEDYCKNYDAEYTDTGSTFNISGLS